MTDLGQSASPPSHRTATAVLIEEARDKLGYSLREAARRTNSMSDVYWGRLIRVATRGRVGRPQDDLGKIDQWCRMAEVVGLPPEAFDAVDPDLAFEMRRRRGILPTQPGGFDQQVHQALVALIQVRDTYGQTAFNVAVEALDTRGHPKPRGRTTTRRTRSLG